MTRFLRVVIEGAALICATLLMMFPGSFLFSFTFPDILLPIAVFVLLYRVFYWLLGMIFKEE